MNSDKIISYNIVKISERKWVITRRYLNGNGVIYTQHYIRSGSWNNTEGKSFFKLSGATQALLSIAKKECGDYSKINPTILEGLEGLETKKSIPKFKPNPEIIKFFQ